MVCDVNDGICYMYGMCYIDDDDMFLHMRIGPGQLHSLVLNAAGGHCHGVINFINRY